MVRSIAPSPAMSHRPADICSWQEGCTHTRGAGAAACPGVPQLLKKPLCRGWNVVESAKWQSWSQLGEMAPVEAMRLYMRLLESEQVNKIANCISCATQTARPHCPSEGGATKGAPQQEAVAVVHDARLHHTCA